jgi:eukaryotic-like serine/threonine-protein kinase
MKALFQFLKSKSFFVQLGIILSIIFLVFLGVITWLSSYTKHGEFIVVPDFKGQQVINLKNYIQNKQVAYLIIDSIYDPKEKPGIVLRQEPEANTKVKHNRTVYLYVTGLVAPQIKMPKLIDRSERQARLILITYGLKVGKVIEKASDCNGCVVAQLIKGSEIEAGKAIKKGSTVDLIVGRKDSFHASALSHTTTNEEEPDFDNEK